jgi:hypothetical protein
MIMGTATPSLITLLLLLVCFMADRGLCEGPTWGADEEEEAVSGGQSAEESQPVGGCPPCDPSSCESPYGCLAGVVRDRCGCCQVWAGGGAQLMDQLIKDGNRLINQLTYNGISFDR